MFMRKERVAQQGRTNYDFRSEQYTRPEWKTRIEFLSTARANKFDELVKTRMLRSVPNPVKSQQEFYQEKGREIHKDPMLQRPRFAQLEEKELRKPVFVGDSQLIFNSKVKGQRETSMKDIVNATKNTLETLAKQKHDTHGRATQETQLIGMEEYSHQTLEGKIDLQKVREIRRAIRRRYASRKNFQKIFSQWDEEGKGSINTGNVLKMIKKLGLNLNYNEARVLVASADFDGSGDLSLDEFMEMIFNDNDAMNVNLKQLNVVNEQDNEEQQEGVMELLHADVQKNLKDRHRAQVNLVLKNKINTLATHLTDLDHAKKGTLDIGKLQDAVIKLQLPPQLVTQDDLKEIFDKYKKDEVSGFDYRAFIKNLKESDVNIDTLYGVSEQTIKKVRKTKRLVSNLLEPTLEDDKVHVFDCTRMNSHMLNKTRNKANQVIKVIQKYLPQKNDFAKLIENNLQDPSTIPLSDLADKITKFLTSVGEQSDKRAVESLVSVIQFNGTHVPPDEVIRVIYDENDTEFFQRCSLRIKGPAPPKSQSMVNLDVDQNTLQQEEDGTKKLSFYSRDLGLSLIPPNQPPKLVAILQKLEDQTFRARAKQFDTFKQFDQDRDGFVSQKDFLQHVENMKILNSQEIQYLIKYIDPNNQGALNFKEFSKKIYAGMTSCNQNGQQILVPSLQPAKERTENLKQHLPDIRRLKSEDNFIKQITGATRFGATPAHKNTFWNIQQPPTDSAMYQDEQSRLNKNTNLKTQFQKDEHDKLQSILNNRLDRIRYYENTLHQRIENNYQDSLQRDANKRQTKGLAVWNYEQRAHLKNDWK